MRPMGTSAMPFMTKRLMPKGGVMQAMFLTSVEMTPNHTRFQPNTLAMGTKMGTQMSTSGMAGMKHPRKQSTTMMATMTSMGAMSRAAMALASTMGMRLRVMKLPSRLAPASRAKHMAVNFPASLRAEESFLVVMRRRA